MKKIIILLILLFAVSAFAETWELAVSIRDEAEAWRKREGDIIGYKPYPWDWGTEEEKHFLILIVNNLTEEEVASLCSPYLVGGVEFPEPTDPPVSPVAKRKYKFAFGTLKNDVEPILDLTQVPQWDTVYQPFKDGDIQIDADTVGVYDVIKNKYLNTHKKVKKHEGD